ncbi:MAG: protein kinase [Myxococcales bacterium]|nr:protein kinase [Myxococcales bacterium]
MRDPFGLEGVVIDAKYRVEHVVGEGGFGVVYRGVHEGFDAPVAIKCLKLPPHFDAAAQDDLIRRLREEGRLLMKLSQRTTGIVQALDIGSFVTPGGARVPYLVLEWLAGRPLSAEITRRARAGLPGMTLREAMRLLDPAAKALGLAHDEKIAHRDIKPDNLFLVEHGATTNVKVLDFGIAKVFADAPSPSDATTGAGPSAFTPAYGAPEQFDKRRGATGPWTDVFALALVLVELLTLERALGGEILAELFQSSLDSARRPTPGSRGLVVSVPVERVFARALAVDPAARIATATELWRELELAIEGGGDVAPRRGSVTSGSASLEEIASAPTLAASRPAELVLGTDETIQAPAALTPPPAATTRAGVASTMNVTQRSADRRRAPAALWALGAAAAAAAIFFGARRLSEGSSQTPPAQPSASSEAKVSANTEAAALYREATRAWRDGATDTAIESMTRAVEIDRELGAGYLRLALWKMSLKESEARDHYQTALLHRQVLTDSDRRLLEAVEPFVRQPWDLKEYSERLEKLMADRPRDAELVILFGQALQARLELEGAVAAFDRALQLEPDLPLAWIERAEAQAMSGDAPGQLASYTRCLEARPASAECLARKVNLRARLGECDAMREDARQLTARAPRMVQGFDQLANALLATGERGPAVQETLSHRWALLPQDKQRTAQLQDRAALATLDGDFEAALALTAEWSAAVAEKQDQFSRGLPALRRARLLEELGEAQQAGEVAKEFLSVLPALPDAIGGDMSIHFLGVAARTRAIERKDYEEKRAAWLDRYRKKWLAAGRRTDVEFEWIAWSTAYGGEVRSVDDAREARDAMPRSSTRAVESGRWPGMDLNVGRTLVLNGEPAAALAPLRRVAAACHRLDEPMRPVLAQLYLGKALELAGDIQEARAAYEKVLAAWGKARPTPLAVTAANEGLARLGRAD